MICQLFDQSVVLTSVLIVKKVIFTLQSFLAVIVSVNFISNGFMNEREGGDMQQRPEDTASICRFHTRPTEDTASIYRFHTRPTEDTASMHRAHTIN